MQKILKKFTKEFFELKDNVFEKNIRKRISMQNFCTKKKLHYVIDDMIFFFAEHFS